jgi:hypothetical protein
MNDGQDGADGAPVTYWRLTAEGAAALELDVTDVIRRDAAFERWWQANRSPADEEPNDRYIAVWAFCAGWEARGEETPR